MNISNEYIQDGKFQALFDFSTESLFLIDPASTNIVYANNTACNAYGYAYDELLKFKLTDISAEQFEINKIINRKHGVVNKAILYHKKKDGSLFLVEIQISLFKIKNQEVIICIIKNVSEIEHDEEVHKQQIKDLLESQRIAHIGTWRLNVLTNAVVWSKELYEMYGFDSTLPVPPYTEHMKLFTAESWSRLSTSLEITRTLGIPYELELKTVTIDGSNGWMWVRGEAEKDTDGNIVSIWGAAQDITERKKTEERIKISENRFKEVLQNLNAGVVIHAPDSTIIDCNDRASQLLGLSFEQIIGKVAIDSEWTFVDEKELKLPIEKYPINVILDAKKSLENYLVGAYHPINNTITWLMVNGTPIFNEVGDVLEVAISFIDVTEVKNAKDQIHASEEQYRLLISEMQLGQALHEIICDESGTPINYRFISVNNAFEHIMGLNKEDIIGRTALEIIPNIEKFWIEKYGEVALKGISIQFENYSSVFNRFYNISAYSPKKGQFAVIVDDITHKKTTEQLLHKEKELFKTTLFSVGDGVISTDTNGNVSIMNKVSEQLTGWTLEEAIGKPIELVFNIIDEVTREKVNNPVVNVLSTRKILELNNHTLLVSRDGTERAVEDSASPIIDEKGYVTGVVLVFRDFTEKKKSVDEIKYISFHDYLTGLYNRRFYEEELTRLDTPRNLPLTLVMGDVNGLKLINDSFGHELGDKLLRKVSEAIKSACRTDDIIARMGGDEFVILLPKTSDDEAKKLIKRINTLLKNETIQGVIVSVSFGYATKTSMEEDTHAIFKIAEDTMYHNKLFDGPNVKGRVIDNIIESLISKSKREEIHSRHVSDLCARMGEALDLEEMKIKELRVFGLLHDIGKIAISDKILNKTEKLNDNEWIEMKSHAETGYRILSANLEMKEIAEYVLAHHERWDGLGYPRGLIGNEIPLQSRICSIADAYDAMISIRSYKPSLDKEVALNELRRGMGKQFDPELVSIFIENVLCESL
jgi:diguanylate cyclase